MKIKPPYGSPCNNCGICCREGICRTGSLVMGAVPAPCPALIEDGDDYLCGLMTRPQDYAPVRTRIEGPERMRAAAKLLIGAGTHCCARYEHEPKVAHPPRLTRKQHAAALKTWGVLEASKAAAARQRAERSTHG
jgi:hypothetical protein